jgi:hypothetical protein
MKKPQAVFAGCGGRRIGGACDYSCCVKAQAEIGYTEESVSIANGKFKYSLD